MIDVTHSSMKFLISNVQVAYNLLSNVQGYYIPKYNSHYMNSEWIQAFMQNTLSKFKKVDVVINGKDDRRIKIKATKG